MREGTAGEEAWNILPRDKIDTSAISSNYYKAHSDRQWSTNPNNQVEMVVLLSLPLFSMCSFHSCPCLPMQGESWIQNLVISATGLLLQSAEWDKGPNESQQSVSATLDQGWACVDSAPLAQSRDRPHVLTECDLPACMSLTVWQSDKSHVAFPLSWQSVYAT